MGLQYGNWHIVQMLGSGSFGTVYEIEQTDELGFSTRSALKVLRIPQSEAQVDEMRSQGESDEDTAEYFREVAAGVLDEVRTMYQLRGCGNIVNYEDHQARLCEDGISWELLIRMELLTPLNKYIRNHEITRETVIHLGIDICNALEQCQALNIIHRDIKPSNILVSNTGDFKLSDFGIARRVAEDATMAVLSQRGTFTYMAPEVFMGKPYGFNVDLYSLGIVMYQLLNDNRVPFLPSYPERLHHGDHDRAMARRMQGETFPRPAHDGGKLAEIVLKACSYDPAERYSSPRQMREDLEAVLRAGAYGGQPMGADAETLTIPGSDRSTGSTSASGSPADGESRTRKLSREDTSPEQEESAFSFSGSPTPEDAGESQSGKEDPTVLLSGNEAARPAGKAPQPHKEGPSTRPKEDAAQSVQEEQPPKQPAAVHKQGPSRGRIVGRAAVVVLVEVLLGIFLMFILLSVCCVICTICGCLLGAFQRERFLLLRWKLLASLVVSLCVAILGGFMTMLLPLSVIGFVLGIPGTLAGFWIVKSD